MSRQTQTLGASFAFLLTGVGTALLGSTLPATLHQWHLSDSRGGLLLLSSWGGSTAGASLVRRNVLLSAVSGLALSAAALIALAWARPSALLPCFFLFGVGLGLTMTAISILRSRESPPAQANLELNRLNLLWAAGACFAPVLALRSLHLLQVGVIFRFAAIAFAASALWLLASAPKRTSKDHRTDLQPDIVGDAEYRPWAPVRLCLFAAASVGLESAVGSWLTTYVARDGQGIALAVSANAAFWVGLLLSRAAHSLSAVPWLHGRASRWWHLACVGVATSALLLAPGKSVVPFAGLLCGWGLGPLYPYVLSIALPRYRSTLVFVLAGVGASVVPWLTGALSSAFGSLRLGLVATELAFAMLVFSAVRMEAADDPSPTITLDATEPGW